MKNQNEVFRIATLSNNARLSEPVAIITAGVGLIQSLFPNFLSSPEPLSDSELNKLFPGSGYWTTQIKSYLKAKTKWKRDMAYWFPGTYGGAYSRGYIAQFVLENRNAICPGVQDNCWSGTVCEVCMEKFNSLLSAEQLGGGTQFPGMTAGFDMQKLLLYGGGALLLFALLKSSKKSNKK